MSGGVRWSQRTTLKTKDASWLSGILAPLTKTGNGVNFPYTPTINMAHSANYGSYDIAGSVYQPNYYVNTPNPQIDLTATFTAQSNTEAEYTAACLHFFKSVLKGDYGQQTRSTSGTPPPVLLLSSYGSMHLENTPVILRSFNYTLPEDLDYVTIEIDGQLQTLPTQLLVSLSFTPQYPPTKVRKEFNINTYRSGKAGGFM